MFRPALLRPSLRALSTSRPVRPLPALRWASTTHAPTNASEEPPLELASQLAPGEEIDPQLNGYPQLPYIPFDTRPPKGWWDNQERRNFGETVHEEEDVLGMWGPDTQPIGGLAALGQLSVAFSLLGVVAYTIYKFSPEPHFVRREYPYNGLQKELGDHGMPARAEEDDEEE